MIQAILIPYTVNKKTRKEVLGLLVKLGEAKTIGFNLNRKFLINFEGGSCNLYNDFLQLCKN